MNESLASVTTVVVLYVSEVLIQRQPVRASEARDHHQSYDQR
jgi:hypothetical protein